MSARREQSAGTSVHHELIYVVIPLRRFLLRGVRDKLFQERIRPTPPGPDRAVPLALPPGEGHPLTMVRRPVARLPHVCIFWGDDPPDPPVWALPTKRPGGFSQACMAPLGPRVWAAPTRRPGGFSQALWRSLGPGVGFARRASWWFLPSWLVFLGNRRSLGPSGLRGQGVLVVSHGACVFRGRRLLGPGRGLRGQGRPGGFFGWFVSRPGTRRWDFAHGAFRWLSSRLLFVSC